MPGGKTRPRLLSGRGCQGLRAASHSFLFSFAAARILARALFSSFSSGVSLAGVARGFLDLGGTGSAHKQSVSSCMRIRGARGMAGEERWVALDCTKQWRCRGEVAQWDVGGERKGRMLLPRRRFKLPIYSDASHHVVAPLARPALGHGHRDIAGSVTRPPIATSCEGQYNLPYSKRVKCMGYRRDVNALRAPKNPIYHEAHLSPTVMHVQFTYRQESASRRQKVCQLPSPRTFDYTRFATKGSSGVVVSSIYPSHTHLVRSPTARAS